MALATRCPHCQTAFKVANDQLKLHAGLVRCGSCQQTFNGIENLIPAEGQKAPVATPAKTEGAKPAVAAHSKPAEDFPLKTKTDVGVVALVSAAATPATSVTTTSSADQVDEAPAASAEKQIAAGLDKLHTDLAPPARVVAKENDIKHESVTASIVRLEPKLEPRLEPQPEPEIDAALETGKIEPVITSSSSLDFDLGDSSFFPSPKEVDETDLNRVELETRAALMDQPAADWSVSDGLEAKEDLAASDAAPAVQEPNGVTKVWRHKDHGEAHELDQADSITDDVNGDVHKEPHLEPYIGEEEAALANHAAINDDSSSDIEEGHKPNFVIQAEKKRARQRVMTVLLGVMIVLLLPLLLGQSAYIFRNQLAARVPETKPYLLQACKLLQCQVTLPTQIDKIVIDSNELQNLAPERHVFMLVMQIQNQGDVVQAWPNIELILNDAKEQPLLKRSFTPDDYLAEKDKLAKGFAAGGEQNIKLYFELPALKAAGFHVDVFYP